MDNSVDGEGSQSPLTQKPKPTHFPFFNLPVELQLGILRHTDLATPLSCVEWRVDDGFRLPVVQKRTTPYLRLTRPETCDPTCGTADDQCHPSKHFDCTGNFVKAYAEPCCFCPHAIGFQDVYLIFSGESCQCQHYICQYEPLDEGSEPAAPTEPRRPRQWQPPTSLSLVSRDFRTLCSTVFYSGNFFHLGAAAPYHLGKLNDPRAQAGPAFLSQVVPASALSALRSVQIDFGQAEAQERYNSKYRKPNASTGSTMDRPQEDERLKTEPVFGEWAQVLERTIDQLRLDTVTLTHGYLTPHPDHVGFCDDEMGHQDRIARVGQVVASLYWTPLQSHPLSVLGGTGNGRDQGPRLLVYLDVVNYYTITPMYYIRRRLGDRVPMSMLMNKLGLEYRSSELQGTGPHRVSDGAPAGPGDEDSTVVHEVYFWKMKPTAEFDIWTVM